MMIVEDQYPTLNNRSSRQNPKRDILELTDFVNQMALTDIYRNFHTNRNESIFLSAPQGTFSKTDYILDTKQISADIRKLKLHVASF